MGKKERILSKKVRYKMLKNRILSKKGSHNIPEKRIYINCGTEILLKSQSREVKILPNQAAYPNAVSETSVSSMLSMEIP